jgi:peptide/nickel transport system permease protein
MTRLITWRVFQAAVVIWAVGSIVFLLSRVAGDPTELMINEYYQDQQAEADYIRAKLGLDKPLYQQYWLFVRDLAQGDLGVSYRRGVPVNQLIRERLPSTLQLTGVVFVFVVVVGIALGVASATSRGTLYEPLLKMFAVIGQAVPNFWAGIVGIWIFAVILGWFPVAGKGGPQHYVLPVLVLGTSALAGMMRLVRASMLDSLNSEYIKLAQAKGVSRFKVVWKHALRNSITVALSYAGLLIAGLATGAIITETVFAWPGIGSLAIDSFRSRDFPVIQGVVIFFTIIYVGVNLAVDVLYIYVDPRIRYR